MVFFSPVEVILGSASQPIHKILSSSSLSFYCVSEFIRLCRLCISLSDSFCLSFAREQSYMESVVTFLQDVVPQVSMVNLGRK